MTISISDYARFSANVYGRANDVVINPDDLNEIKSAQNTITTPTGWSILRTQDNSDTSADDGFIATAYEKGDQIVIAYCGTTVGLTDWFQGNIPAGAGLW